MFIYIFPHCNTEDDVGTPVHCIRNFPLLEIFKTYAESKGIDESSFRFCIGDKEIQHNDTPNSLQLEDNCLIIAKRVILVKVKDETGEETTYRINMFGMMSGVFKDYANRKGVEETSLVFYSNNNMISQNDTPDSLQLEDDCLIIAKRVILVKVKDETGEETTYRINKFGMMSGVFKDYASRKGVEESSLHYSINGNRILPIDTPDSLQLDNDAVIDVESNDIDRGDSASLHSHESIETHDESNGILGQMRSTFGQIFNNTIKVTVKEFSKDKGTVFKMNRSSPMSKVFKAYARRKGVEESSLRFQLDGENIQATDTPLSLELEEGDQIDALTEAHYSAADQTDVMRAITLQVRDDSGEITQFKVRRSVKMSEIFKVYASRKGVDVSSFRYLFEGKTIQETDTPDLLNLRDDDLIVAKREEKISSVLQNQNKHPCNRLIVEEATNDDNSVISLSPAKMEELLFFRGDTIIIEGKKGRDTACVVLADETCDNESVRMNEVVRNNLRVRSGDTVTLTNGGDIPYGKRIHILPLADTIEGVSDNLFDDYIKPYFSHAYRPVKKGDLFLVHSARHSVEFKVVETNPAPYCIVAPDTVIHFDGKPVKRKDKEDLISFRITYSETGEETIHFVNKSSPMSKVFKTYADRKGVDESSLRFLLDGEFIQENDTPLTLDLENDDLIDAMRNDIDNEHTDEIMVEGCGIDEINGVYKRQGSNDDVPKYVHSGRYNGNDEEFTLYRCKLMDDTR